jgi:sucrose phosphorylase
MIASQSILLSLAGVPGIYVHSLFGSRNCQRCYEETGRARSLNREKFDLAALETLLDDADSHQARVFAGYRAMLAVRRTHSAFHPFGDQEIRLLNPAIFAVLRTSPAGDEQMLCLTNVSDREQQVSLPAGRWRDTLKDDGMLSGDITLPAYGVLWLLRK